MFNFITLYAQAKSSGYNAGLSGPRFISAPDGLKHPQWERCPYPYWWQFMLRWAWEDARIEAGKDKLDRFITARKAGGM